VEAGFTTVLLQINLSVPNPMPTLRLQRLNHSRFSGNCSKRFEVFDGFLGKIFQRLERLEQLERFETASF